jgi:hypothetical protein
LFTVTAVRIKSGVVLYEVLKDRLVAETIDSVAGSSQKFFDYRFSNPTFNDILRVHRHSLRDKRAGVPQSLCHVKIAVISAVSASLMSAIDKTGVKVLLKLWQNFFDKFDSAGAL